ncbi:MAG TPA: ABC transporter permease [Gammaproteobacteria bacterium]|jgi:ABC-2 type transport system permease protein|nr:ABC transporter permease [Gammaproteobacteria bacterium]
MNALVARPLARTARIYLLETRSEFLRVLRTPGSAIPLMLFPLMFYAFFGVMLANGKDAMLQSLYALAGLGSFGVITPGLFGFGAGFALDRGLGWLQVKRASPMPPAAYLLAKLGMSSLFSLLITLSLFAMAAGLAHLRMEAGQWSQLAITLVLGNIPFCAMGLAVGAWAKPQSAPAVVNLIYLPMSFMSGLWMPLQFLPAFMQKLAVFLPAYHLGRLAYSIVGLQPDAALPHVLALLGFTVGFLLVAACGYRLNPPSNG